VPRLEPGVYLSVSRLRVRVDSGFPLDGTRHYWRCGSLRRKQNSGPIYPPHFLDVRPAYAHDDVEKRCQSEG